MALVRYPDLGINVNVHLANGTTLFGYWDGLNWWVGVPDEPNDVPLNNDFVVSWTPASGA